MKPLVFLTALLLSSTEVHRENPMASLEEAVPRFQRVRENLFRGGQPPLASLGLLKEAGIQQIVNLRHEKKWIEKEREEAERLGIRYVSFPWNGLRVPRKEFIEEIVQFLENSKEIPTFIHCRRGRERTGFVVGRLRMRSEGWSPGEAYAEMRRLGFRPLLFGHLKEAFFQFAEEEGYEVQRTGFFEKLKTKCFSAFYGFRQLLPACLLEWDLAAIEI